MTAATVTAHQPRERPIACVRCTRPTFEVHGSCADCGPDVCPHCHPNGATP